MRWNPKESTINKQFVRDVEKLRSSCGKHDDTKMLEMVN